MSRARTLALWCPDWPVVAAAQSHAPARGQAPVALIDKGLVSACSAAAREEGVQTGLRVREAQNRCPELVVLAHDEVRDVRVFDAVLRVVEEVVPGVQMLEPGLAAVRAKGASRFYGGEEQAARALVRRVREQLPTLPLADLRVGVADGTYAAQQAARHTTPGQPLEVIPPDGSPDFLGALPIGVLDDRKLVTFLRRVGIDTLGEFAELSPPHVHARFGDAGREAHLLARGAVLPAVAPRTVPPHLTREIDFEPGLDGLEQVAASCAPLAEKFIAALVASNLVCTQLQLRVYATSLAAPPVERVWTHPRHFAPTDIVDRLRWQLAEGLTDVVVRVEVAPLAVDDRGHHARGLWGEGPDERVQHTLTGLQSRLGHLGVLASAVVGGRLLADRRLLRPWGEAMPSHRTNKLDQPWPGRVTGPAPSMVFATPPAVRVLAEDNAPVRITDRGALSATPRWLCQNDHRVAITGWAGPWPIRQRWWSPAQHRRLDRFQVLAADGTAWLLLLEKGRWLAEARYD
ncbi:DNA polymerase Y family protein [Nocardioides speluncae]|uniref:DNA polymerase Y family protein n=1 Tax=Nocardioides speluncae TaxID=2670337 RepID=UPI000D697973|nr:DNA polymerase Y family protein [Nocardioides speluncae]